jgi:hypothetical protein
MSAPPKDPRHVNIGLGLCVSLPLHKCSNYSKKLIGQIAQNPCYMKARLIKTNFK